jgi:hypothetical protein
MTEKGNLTPDTSSEEFQDARDTAYLCLMQNWSEIAQKYSELLLNTTEGYMSFTKLNENINKEGVSEHLTEYTGRCVQKSSVFSEISNRELELWAPLFILSSAISEQFTEDLYWLAKILVFSSQKEARNESNEAKLTYSLLKATEELKASSNTPQDKLDATRIREAFRLDWHPTYDPKKEERHWLTNQFIGNLLNTIDNTGRIWEKNRSGARGNTEYTFNLKQLKKYALNLGIDITEFEKKEPEKSLVAEEIDASKHSGAEKNAK